MVNAKTAMTTSDFLRQVPLFARLSPSELDSLRALAHSRRYAAGEIIFHEGDEGTALYIIEKGEVKIALGSAEGKEVVFTLLGPGDPFGELALLDGEPRSADALAKETSEVLILRRQDFLRFLAEHRQVALDLLAVLSRRLRRTDDLVADAAFLDVRARLVKRLLALAQTSGQPGPQGSLAIASKLTQSDLADMVGTTRESINKALQYYIKKGLLRHERGRLTLLDPKRLEEDLS